VSATQIFLFKGPESASRAAGAVGAVLSLGLISVALVATVHLRTQAEQNARNLAEDHAYALAVHAGQALTAADNMAEGLVRSISARNLGNGDQLARELGSQTEQRMLALRRASFEGIELLAIVGPMGELVNNSNVYPPPKVNFSLREAFQSARDRTQSGSHLSAPVINLVDGRWTFYLSRRLEDAHGRFLGAVLVGLSPQYFSNFYSVLRPDRSNPLTDATAMTLLRDDRTVMARSPHDDEALGRQISGHGPYATVGGQKTEGAGSDDNFEPWDARPQDPDRFILATDEVDGFPLRVAVALSDKFYLAQWRKQAQGVGVFTAIAAFFILGTFSTLVRLLRRRERHLLEVERLRAEAEAASRAKTNFLATVSHEVRTPLNGILGTADLLVRSGLQPKQLELASTLLTSGRNLLSIINDILDLSKIEADELQIHVAPFSPRSVLHDVLSLFTPYASGKGLGLAMHVDNRVPAVLGGDAQRVKQVVGNLVSNAIKFTDRGDVKVNVSWPIGADGFEVLHIDVCDSGVGVPPEARERIFQPFAQADGSISRRFGGTGLGLAISKRLVTMMGGRIDFSSTPGEGSCFWVELPLPEVAGPVPDGHGHEYSDWTFAHGGAMPLPPAGAEEPAQPQAARVLVVEDNAINAMVVEAQLSRLGCACDVAVDGEEALQRLSATRYDLVLMDCMLPGISGFEATRRWRAIEAEQGGSRVTIVALTANALASNFDEARESGMDDFLTKPCTLDKLKAVLRQWQKTQSPPVT